MKSISITVPRPCSEKWSSFRPTEKGGYCLSCKKEVIDFSSWSEHQLKEYLKNISGSTCGRFKPEQLKVYTFEESQTSRYHWLPSIVIGLLVLLTTRQGLAQRKHKSEIITEQTQPVYEVGKVAVPLKSTIKGIVNDESGTGIPGTNVQVFGAGESTTTDAYGNFVLTINRPVASVELVFSFIGYKTVNQIFSTQEPQDSVTVTLVPDVMVLGGMESYRLISPRRWWWNLKQLLR